MQVKKSPLSEELAWQRLPGKDAIGGDMSYYLIVGFDDYNALETRRT